MFHYWSMPGFIQAIIAKAIPKKDTWSIKATKNAMGDWVFDIPPFIKDEAITGGSQFIIDTYYIHCAGQPPQVGDVIYIDATSVKPKFHHAVCSDFKDADGFGHFFIEQNTQMDGWFCPVFDIMFGKIPEKIWVTFATEYSSDEEAIEQITGININNI